MGKRVLIGVCEGAMLFLLIFILYPPILTPIVKSVSMISGHGTIEDIEPDLFVAMTLGFVVFMLGGGAIQYLWAKKSNQRLQRTH